MPREYFSPASFCCKSLANWGHIFEEMSRRAVSSARSQSNPNPRTVSGPAIMTSDWILLP